MIRGPTRDINWQTCKLVKWMLQMSHLRAFRSADVRLLGSREPDLLQTLEQSL